MSLRTRLLLALGAVALVALIVADIVTYQELRSFLFSGIDQALETAHKPIEAAIGGGGPGQPGPGAQPGHNPLPGAGPGAGSTPSPEAVVPPTPGCKTFDGISYQTTQGLMPGTFIEIRSSSGSVLYRCSISPGPGQKTLRSPALASHITGFSSNEADFGEPTTYFSAPSASSSGPEYEVRASILTSGPHAGGELIVAVPLGSTSSTLSRLLDVELLVTAAALLGALLLGWWLVRVGLHPLRAVERTADAIAAGELEQRVPGDQAKTEVGRLARALNVMLGRIEHAFAQRDATEAELRDSEQRMRQFVADASHELRTPLAAVAAYAELFERGASTRPEDLTRVMEGIRSETSRMGRLVDDLLLLARLDEGRPLERNQVELVEMAAQSVSTASAVAPAWPVRLEASRPVEVLGDRSRLRQVVDNLLSNVRAHTPPGTEAVVAISTDDGDAVLSVSDNGPGLPPESEPHVFERFYRADSSRTRSKGGAGLGLSIVSSIVQAHGGRVLACSSSGGGALFTVRIPLDRSDLEDGFESAEQFTANS